MNKILKINIFYYISFILLIINRYINTKSIISSILIPLLIILLSYLLSMIYYKLIKKDKTSNRIINSRLPIINTLCYFLTNNIIISLIIILILSIFYKIIKINYICIYMIIYYLITKNLNIIEYNIYNQILLISSYVILLFNEYYKKDIPLFIINSYVITALILYVLKIGDIESLTDKFLNSNIIYIAIYIAAISNYSPLIFKNRIIYSLIIGISSCLLISLTNYTLPIYIIILVLSIITEIRYKIR